MINMTKQEKMNDREIKNLAKNWSYGRYSNENSVIEKYKSWIWVGRRVRKFGVREIVNVGTWSVAISLTHIL